MPLSSHPQIPHNVFAIRDGLTANVDAIALTTQSATSSMTMPSDSQAPSSSQPAEVTRVSLPPPQLFDILPALHELLARIERSTHLEHTSSDASSPTDDIGAHYQDQPPLEPKDLPTEILAIKAKIRKALREVEKLPDLESSVEEQEEEIKELEERIGRQRATLGRFGEMARESGLR